MSEPDAGSDAWTMRTRAVLDGDNWRISGTKQWISNGPLADYALVLAGDRPGGGDGPPGAESRPSSFRPTLLDFGWTASSGCGGSVGGNESNPFLRRRGGAAGVRGRRGSGAGFRGRPGQCLYGPALQRRQGRRPGPVGSGAGPDLRLGTGDIRPADRGVPGRPVPLVESAMEIHAAHTMGPTLRGRRRVRGRGPRRRWP